MNLSVKTTVTKVTIYITLLILFYFFYMMDVLNQYAGQKTNFAKSTDNILEKGVDMPALTFCLRPIFKPSMLKHHNISATFCITPNLVDETNQFILENANLTWNEFCLNISYKLERDFTLDLSDSWVVNNGTKMKTGINKVGETEVELREVFTKLDGLCYAMLSEFKWYTNSWYYIRITYLVGFELLILIFWYVNQLFHFRKIWKKTIFQR